MDVLELMKERHSVRQYTEQKIEDEKRRILDELVQIPAHLTMHSAMN